MSVSIKLDGAPELAEPEEFAVFATFAAFSSKVGPKSASRPRPRPLGRLVTIFSRFLCLNEVKLGKKWGFAYFA
jgi:hypothetical protein